MKSAHVIHTGDCREVLAAQPAESVDACVTDPPYELGFMSHGWDSSGIAHDVQLWRQVLRVLRPGGYLLAFGGTRTYHRMACAIEDAGFTIRDSLHWMYGTGFPKGKACLKPGHEPIVLACKGKARELNVDGCRIGSEVLSGSFEYARRGSENRALEGANNARPAKAAPSGRWPANVILDEDAAAELDAQSGDRSSHGDLKPCVRSDRDFHAFGRPPPIMTTFRKGDAGGASRFFYVAKASRRERGPGTTHPTVKPVALMRWLCRLVTPTGGLVLDPFMGSGTTGLAARAEGFRFVGVELSPEYVAMAERRLAAVDPLLAWAGGQ